MKLEILYRDQVKKSKKLTEYAESKISHFDKWELKPSAMRFQIYAKHHHCVVDVSVRGPDLFLKATGMGDDHFAALDQALHKVESQLSRRKGKIQFHKKKEFSHEGVLARMSAQMDHTFQKRPRGKKSPRAA